MKIIISESQYEFLYEQTAYERQLDKIYSKPETAQKHLDQQKEFFNSIIPTIPLPLHLKCLWFFLIGRTDKMSENELKPSEKNFLFQVAKNYGLKQGFTYSLWRSLGASNLPTAVSTQGIEKETKRLKNNTEYSISKLANPSLAGQFMYTLGQVSKSNIKQVDEYTIKIIDNYDMNSFDVSPVVLLDELTNVISLYMKGKATAYSIVRKLVGLREIAGYKGFPIEFNLKSTVPIK